MSTSKARLGILLALSLITVFLWPDTPLTSLPPPTPPKVGFSFSPLESRLAGHEPTQDLDVLLSLLQPDLIRLGVYWSTVEATQGKYDFSETDKILNHIRQHNLVSSNHPTKVILVIGVRNILTPEVHAPAWAPVDMHANLRQILSSVDYRTYFRKSIELYRNEPLLYTWQVENEPLDNVTTGRIADDSIPPALLSQEITEVHAIDPYHRVVVNTYNSSSRSLDELTAAPFGFAYFYRSYFQSAGHPGDALGLADILGLDLYVVTPSEPFEQVDVSTRIAWKLKSAQYWNLYARSKNKELWITEMQASPWDGKAGFNLGDLQTSTRLYRASGASVILFWDVQEWLSSPQWMEAGQLAFGELRDKSR